jgi:hypothetical protein
MDLTAFVQDDRADDCGENHGGLAQRGDEADRRRQGRVTKFTFPKQNIEALLFAE